MTTLTTEALARGLLKGQLPSAVDWEIAKAVDLLCRVLNGVNVDGFAPPPAKECLTALELLNEHRQFKPAAALGEVATLRYATKASVDRDSEDFHARIGIARRYIQALIDSGDLDGADQALQLALSTDETGHSEYAELRGLAGRLAKQRFVVQTSRTGSGDDKDLLNAIARYGEVYRANRAAYWHGINAIALAARAENHNISSDVAFDWRKESKLLLKTRQRAFRTRPDDLWSIATAAECCVALEKWDEAELWLYRYVTHPAVTPFMLASTARQFREIWELRRDATDGGRLLQVLDREILESGGSFQIDAQRLAERSTASSDYLEKVFGQERYMGYDRWRRALEGCEAIARVEQVSGAGVGTGFLVQGSQLHPSLGDGPVFLTNAHVISASGQERSLKPEQAFIRFEVQARRAISTYVPLTVERILWSSPPGQLGDMTAGHDACDVTVCMLNGLGAESHKLDLAKRLPMISSASRAYIVGHPEGSGLQFSIADSELLDIDDQQKLVHYRTPTVGGSSGSPVFDLDWNVFAIHHAGATDTPRLHGEGSYAANEGISMQAIRAAMEASPPSP